MITIPPLVNAQIQMRVWRERNPDTKIVRPCEEPAMSVMFMDHPLRLPVSEVVFYRCDAVTVNDNGMAEIVNTGLGHTWEMALLGNSLGLMVVARICVAPCVTRLVSNNILLNKEFGGAW